MDVWSQKGEDAAPTHSVPDFAASSCSPLLRPAFHPGKREFPGTSLLLPAHAEVPQERMDTEKLLMFVVLSFNRVGQKSYCEPKPMDLHRFHTPC
jgi:hypothetical protein